MNLRETRDAGGRHGHEQPDGDPREGQAQRARRHGEEDALGEVVPGEVRAVGAECGADRHLAPPPFQAHEEEVRNVRARDHQHQRHSTQNHPERARGVAHYRIAKRGDVRREVVVAHEPGRVRRRELLRESRRETREIGARRVDGGVSSETADRPVAVIVDWGGGRVEPEWEPELGIGGGTDRREVLVRRQYPHHLHRIPFDADRLADYPRIAAEAGEPVRVREHGDGCRARAVVVRVDRSTERCVHAEDLADARGDLGGSHSLRAPASHHREIMAYEDADRIEGAVVIQVIEVASRRHAPLAGDRLAGDETPDLHEAVGVRVGEGIQHHAVEERVHGGRCSDPERKGEDRYEREAAASRQRAQCLPRFAADGVEQLHASPLVDRSFIYRARFFSIDVDTSEARVHFALGLGAREPASHEVVDASFDVKAKLGVYVVADAVWRAEEAEGAPELRPARAAVACRAMRISAAAPPLAPTAAPARVHRVPAGSAVITSSTALV